MAYITGNPRTEAHDCRAETLIERIARAFATYIARRARTDQMQALYRLSDAELARLGLTRDQIPLHVFRDRIGF